MIALLTPTGGRPDQIKLCERWMQNQDYKGKVIWIIVDDCEPRTTENIKRDGWSIKKIYPDPAWQPGQNTQARNIAAGINYIKTLSDIESIFIIEDDDYYKSIYLSTMVEKLKDYDIAGELCTMYYNVKLRTWLRNGNMYWSSLFQTAFTPAVIPILEKIYYKKYIDYHLFPAVARKNMFTGNDLGVGIKGQNGRGGIGAGHQELASYKPDPAGAKLYELIGDDVKYYINDWNSSNILH
jgi:hypothetical protein